ncbi:FRG domain-containing protein [Colwellia psychrerythraea]|uniref:FRG domain protein n=1 Tax=Colwellia psychrerythraea TaxID=28229 RepID=A0A099KN88_COLPS|nr:FRG domain-containing protein [Colwellia psychrerythraea]KGJ91941.1 FRG domain protein [Colwellia psychrerythraea]
MTNQINSLEDLFKLISIEDDEVIYRGQSNENWLMIPSIGRFENIPTAKFERFSWKYIEEDMIHAFQKKAIPYLKSEAIPNNHFEWLILAQHHGLPTRLLDFTTNPLKALFFAVEDIGVNEDGVLLKAHYNNWWSRITEIFNKIDDDKRLAVYFPDHTNHRIISQEGCFTIFPLPENMEKFHDIKNSKMYKHGFESLDSFIIPYEAKSKIRAQLRKLGIAHHTIYPGLDGLCTEIRRDFEFLW